MTVTEARDELVSLPEAARRLGVHRATVNDMVRDERLPAQRFGAHWQVRRSDLDRFAASYVRPPNAPKRRRPTLPESAPRIIELLGEFETASVAELTPFLGLHEGNVRKHLRLLELEGLVRRTSDGEWRLTGRNAPVDGKPATEA